MSGDILKSVKHMFIVQGQSFRRIPPLVSIPVGGLFECVGIDFVEFNKSVAGNCYTL